MKFVKIVLVLVVLFFQLHVFAQKKDSIKFAGKRWSIDEHYAYKTYHSFDTLLDHFQVYNPLFSRGPLFAGLGNIGLPAYSFSNSEIFSSGTFYSKAFRPYLFSSENTLYYNVNSPYSDIQYSSSMKKVDEQTLDFIQTRNFSDKFNIGFQYRLIASSGQFYQQATRNSHYRLFSSYAGVRYEYYFSININKCGYSESGGYLEDTSLNKEKIKSKERFIPSVDSTRSVFLNRDFAFFQKVNFGKKIAVKEKDSIIGYRIESKFSIAHSMRFKQEIRNFYSGKSDTGFNRAPLNSLDSNDSANVKHLTNTLYLNLIDLKNSKYGIKPKLYLSNDLYYSKMYSKMSDTLHSSFVNTKAGAYLLLGEKARLKWYADAYIGLSGYIESDIYIKAGTEINFSFFKDTAQVVVYAENHTFKPDYSFSNYISNYLKWDIPVFAKTNLRHLHLNGQLQRSQIDVSFDYYSVSNFVYFDSLLIPIQSSGTINSLSLSLRKNVNMNWLQFDNQVVLQYTDKYKIIHVPSLLIYSSLYTNFYFFKKALRIQLGMDLWYASSYYLPAWMPVSGTFYNQSSIKSKEVPMMDVFLNMEIKKVRIFLKYSNANTAFDDRTFSQSLNYPTNPATFVYGISWRFYD